MLRSGIYLLVVNSTIVSLRAAEISWVDGLFFHETALVGLSLSFLSFMLYYPLSRRRRSLRARVSPPSATPLALQTVSVRS
jgi:hypothetical protein